MFRDYLPKICTQELIDTITKFIAIELKLKIRNENQSIDEIIGEDFTEILRTDLQKRQNLYSEP